MAEPPPTPAAPPIDRDLYCLTCGYNLRGLGGDPVRCPECGNLNPVGDAEIPAEIITRKLRQMETAPAICVGAAILSLPLQIPFWSFWIVAWTQPTAIDAGSLCCSIVPMIATVSAWIASVGKFRSSCLDKQGWAGLLVRYHTCGLVAAAAIVGSMFLGAHLMWSYGQWHHGVSGWLLFVSIEIAICAVAVVAIRWLLKGPYERLAADMHVLQREVAVTIAREESRQRMAQQKRSLFH